MLKIREILWEGEHALQVTIFDITERKRTEEVLRQQIEALARANAALQQGIVPSVSRPLRPSA
jgi:hypothetical protein